MSSMMQQYEKLCREGLISVKRRKNFLSALRHLAAAFDTTPDRLTLTPEVKGTYRDRLKHYLIAQSKSPLAIRNASQEIGQLIRLIDVLPQAMPIPQVRNSSEPIPRSNATFKAMRETSPYEHQAFLTQSPYFLKMDKWPENIKSQFEVYRALKRNHLRAPTLGKQIRELQALLGYLSMTGSQRLEKLAPHALEKLSLKRYTEDQEEILAAPVLSSWDDLFNIRNLDSFLTWGSWRIHTQKDAEVKERRPSRPSTMGYHVVKLIAHIAITLNRDDAPAIRDYRNILKAPKKIHDKKADIHTFSFAELEQVGLAMIDEARRTHSNAHDAVYPGSIAATRFQAGLILMLGWRNPMRARNWCEAIDGINLKRINGRWLWHFEREELKVGMRAGEPNIHEFIVPPDVDPYMTEYMEVWRPKLPNADRDRHVFLSKQGKPFTDTVLRNRLRINVYRYTKKHLFTHLLRTIFTRNHLTASVDINSVAYGLGDTPAMVLRAYNELQAEKHRPILDEANRRALENVNGTSR
jgi:hypothetical protein